ncbi:hypothetical protein FACS1894189_7290 [Planctomycetales bacterium]|nr:hypothetical protein FACS1894189_7290 [Planctomycetales bacterium]
MGIRFFCPNGHKLNVKSYLAGKVGYCPECNVRMTIPMESVQSSSASNASITIETPSTRIEPAPQFSMLSENPLLQDQTVSWYFQVSDGSGQPISNAEMIRSLQNGTIKRNTMIWREGWEFWSEAQDVFPEL